jgi:hypothetical protein
MGKGPQMMVFVGAFPVAISPSTSTPRLGRPWFISLLPSRGARLRAEFVRRGVDAGGR